MKAIAKAWYTTQKIKRHVFLPNFSYLKGWFVICFVSNSFNICGSCLNISEKLGYTSSGISVSVLNGLGCFLIWLMMLKYFESFKLYYTMIKALQRGLPNVTRLVISAFPVLLAYTLFGVEIFAEVSDNFNSFDHAFAALFSTLNGDNLYQRFIGSSGHTIPWLISRFYQYSFVCVACYAILNIFIAIIQESYTATRIDFENIPSADAVFQPKFKGEELAERKSLTVDEDVIGDESNVTMTKKDFRELMKLMRETKTEVANLERKFAASSSMLQNSETSVNINK